MQRSYILFLMIALSLVLGKNDSLAQANASNHPSLLAYFTQSDARIISYDGTSVETMVDLQGDVPLSDGQWSPDGQYFAFFSFTCGEPTSLCLVDMSDFHISVLAEDLHAPKGLTWSPDGQYVAFAANVSMLGNNAIFLIRPDGTDLHMVTTCDSCRFSHLVWSPDSTKIVFLYGGLRSGDLASINYDGSGYQQLTSCSNCSNYRHIIWSPDSAKVAYEVFEAGSKIYTISIHDREQQLISENSVRMLFWSDDSSTVGRLTEFGICPFFDDVCTSCGNPEDWYGDYPFVSPDRISILQLRSNGQIYLQRLTEPLDILQMTFDENPASQLGDSIDPAWSADGQYIAFRSTRIGPWNLYVMDANQENMVKIADSVRSFSWQPE